LRPFLRRVALLRMHSTVQFIISCPGSSRRNAPGVAPAWHRSSSLTKGLPNDRSATCALVGPMSRTEPLTQLGLRNRCKSGARLSSCVSISLDVALVGVDRRRKRYRSTGRCLYRCGHKYIDSILLHWAARRSPLSHFEDQSENHPPARRLPLAEPPRPACLALLC